MLFVASNIKRTLRKMKKLNFLIPIFFLTSCATLMLKKDYNIKVSSNVPNAKAEIQDSVYSLPSEFLIKRSKEDLNIKLFTDSIERNYIVKASPNAKIIIINSNFFMFFVFMTLHTHSLQNKCTTFVNRKQNVCVLIPLHPYTIYVFERRILPNQRNSTAIRVI
jgi:hypothetical protein